MFLCKECPTNIAGSRLEARRTGMLQLPAPSDKMSSTLGSMPAQESEGPDSENLGRSAEPIICLKPSLGEVANQSLLALRLHP